MKAGRLRHRLRLEAVTDSVDSFGGVVKTFAQVAEVPASIESVSGREYLSADRDLADVTVKIHIRNQPPLDIDPSWRAVDVDNPNSVFDIRAVLPSHYRDQVVLMCRRGSSHS